MDAGEINKKLEKLEGMDKEQKSAVLELIDIKVNSDMEKVLSGINTLKLEMDAKFSSIEASTTSKFDGLKSEIIGINHKIEGQQKSIYIIIAGLIFAIISFFLNK